MEGGWTLQGTTWVFIGLNGLRSYLPAAVADDHADTDGDDQNRPEVTPERPVMNYSQLAEQEYRSNDYKNNAEEHYCLPGFALNK